MLINVLRFNIRSLRKTESLSTHRPPPLVFLSTFLLTNAVITQFLYTHCIQIICAIVVTIDQWGMKSTGVETPGVATRLHANYLANPEAVERIYKSFGTMMCSAELYSMEENATFLFALAR